MVGAAVIEFELPEPDYAELALVNTDGHRGIGSGGAEAESLEGKVLVDGPCGRRLTHEEVLAADPEQATFLGQDGDGSEYSLVWLWVSFPVIGLSKLESAQVKLTLTAIPATPEPVVVSMRPLSVDDPVSVERTIAIGPKMKIFEAVDVEAGHYEKTETFQRTNLVVRGLPNGTYPQWEFTRTPSRKLDGPTRLVMIVRSGHGAVLEVNGKVTARRPWGSAIWHFGAQLRGGPLVFGDRF